MTPQQASRQIKELLDSLLQKKTSQERLSLIVRVKALVEILQEQFEKQSRKDADLASRKRVIKGALKQLLTTLDRISRKHEEVGDTDVRERMHDAIRKGFIKPRPGYALPATFGMFSDRGNTLVRQAIEAFLTHPEVVAARQSLKTPADRLEAFQDYDVESSEGTTCFDYFGYANA